MWKAIFIRNHPDWTIDIPGREHAEGRNQRILDLTRTEVQDFIIEKMSEVFFFGRHFLCEMGYEPDVYRLFLQGIATGAAGRGRTPLCARTLPLLERTDKPFPGYLI